MIIERNTPGIGPISEMSEEISAFCALGLLFIINRL